jgi:hypothetical protein
MRTPLLAACPSATLARGNWPDSHCGGGTGLGGGSAAGSTFILGGLGAAWVGITDSSHARLLAGSPLAPPVAMYCISFMAATLVALEVWWTPSPAQMLDPSTVVISCKGDSSGPKNPRIFRILASTVRSPAAAASARHFPDPEISVKNSGSCRKNSG